METKLFEIRDEGTLIPVLAIKSDGVFTDLSSEWLWDRAGYAYGIPYVLLTQLSGGSGLLTCDPFDWEVGRTLREAHLYIKQHFDELLPGSVIDVEYILGITSVPKTSESH